MERLNNAPEWKKRKVVQCKQWDRKYNLSKGRISHWLTYVITWYISYSGDKSISEIVAFGAHRILQYSKRDNSKRSGYKIIYFFFCLQLKNATWNICGFNPFPQDSATCHISLVDVALWRAKFPSSHNSHLGDVSDGKSISCDLTPLNSFFLELPCLCG